MSLSTNQSTRARVAVGKYILESISVGMYDTPLMAIREYVQNAVDSIDSLEDQGGRNKAYVDISIDGRHRSLKITDTGTGIPSVKAMAVLHDLGNSDKDPRRSRGFRGMGRLAGLAYCQELKFLTKSKGESVISISTWNCRKLASLIAETGTAVDAASAVDAISSFDQQPTENKVGEHYFTVEMNGIQGNLNSLLNVPLIKEYVSQVAPVPFYTEKFSFGEDIEASLKENVPLYNTYRISVNGEVIYKPYSDTFRAHGGLQKIERPRFISLSNGSSPLAFCWLAEWAMNGTIDPTNLVDGLRMRSGNILVGDKNVLSDFFREKRFNNYLVGEVHVADAKLVPNSRRDDLEDNSTREGFRNCFVKEIGIPFSRRIRDLSSARSVSKRVETRGRIWKSAQTIVERGYLAEAEKQHVIKPLRELMATTQDSAERSVTEDMLSRVEKSKHALDMLDGKVTKILGRELGPYKALLEVVFRETADKESASAILDKALSELLQGRP